MVGNRVWWQGCIESNSIRTNSLCHFALPHGDWPERRPLSAAAPAAMGRARLPKRQMESPHRNDCSFGRSRWVTESGAVFGWMPSN